MPCRCLIIEDEVIASKLLETYIGSIAQLKLIEICRNSLEALELINSQRPDLIFLDIHLPDLKGIEMLKTLKDPPSTIITTADKEFAVEAFEQNAVDFLIKPFTFERFLKAVNKVLQADNLKTFPKSAKIKTVYFRCDRKMIKVALDEILYLEKICDHLIVHLENNRKLRVKLSLSEVMEMLPEDRFLRIHRSFIVARDKITAFTKTDVEISKIELPISRSYANTFLKLAPHYNYLPKGVCERS